MGNFDFFNLKTRVLRNFDGENYSSDTMLQLLRKGKYLVIDDEGNAKPIYIENTIA